LVVLLTNFDLDGRGGTQLYVRDVALRLLARGHTPVAYSPRLGEVARELAAATVPVTDDLRTLTVPPDIVHGHHNHELFTALLRFPAVPAVRLCHGWQDERPQPFPRVLRYLAVSEAIRDRCIYEWGVPADRLDVILDCSDVGRRVQATAAVDAAVDALLVCYHDVVEEYRRAPRDLDAESLAAAAYLRALSPRVYWTETSASTRQLLLESVYMSTRSLPVVRTVLRTRWARRLVLSAREWRRRLTTASPS
jgi:hypothetical protein